MLKKILSVILALTMVAGLVGCGGTEIKDPDVTIDAADLETYETPNLNGETLDLYMPANDDFDAEGSYADQVISKALNVNVVYHELDSFDEQYYPMMAEGIIPSLTSANSWTDDNNKMGEDGAYINIYDYLDAMPNVKKFLEENEAAQAFIRDCSAASGVLYAIPIVESGNAECSGYIYRQDIFEANDMTFPTTQDELYNTLKQLKTLYPESYPFVMRHMNGNMNGVSRWAPTWGSTNQEPGVINTYLTLQNGNYVLSPATQGYKEIAAYMKQLLEEELMHPSTMTLDGAGWIEAFASGTSFISFDKMDRLPSINQAGQAVDPNFKVVGAAPIAMGTNGRAETQAPNATIRTFMIGKNDQLETTLKFVDWLYSEEGIIATNWGVEGESYKVNADGEKELTLADGTFGTSGLGKYGVVGFKDFDAYLASVDEDLADSIRTCLEKATADPQVRLVYNEEDQLTINTYGKPCYRYAVGEVTKFIMGMRDFSEWDTYLEELETYHLSELVEIHEKAYAEAMKK